MPPQPPSRCDTFLVFSLPLSAKLSDTDIDDVIAALRDAVMER